jgi:hypothetical protein
MFIALMFSFFLTGAAAADSNGKKSQAVQVDQAEAIRLSQELEKLSKRNAWAGVERTYIALVKTKGTMTREDHTRGAHAAQALGKMAEARSRLQLANQFGEDTEIMDWLWDIDSNYGRVFLAGDLETISLTCLQMPFNPIQAKAVQYAIQEIASHGIFEGLLPQGEYQVHMTDKEGPQKSVHVMPRIQNVRIDLRTAQGLKRAEKKRRKASRDEEKKRKRL